MKPKNLHIFFLPYLAPGHMIPMVDLAKIFASRGVKSTIVTTTDYIHLIKPTIDRSCYSIEVLTLNLQSSAENVETLLTPMGVPELIKAVEPMRDPFQELLDCHHPDIIISDIFYTWTVDMGLPRLAFHGTSVFCTVVSGLVTKLLLQQENVPDESFVVPGIPHRVEILKSQLMGGISEPDDSMMELVESYLRSYGMITNTFYGLESEYINMVDNIKLWHVGPVSMCNQDASETAVRGGEGEKSWDRCLNWLDGQEPGSVLYVCFGSAGRFPSTQLHELAEGLKASGHKFIWVVKNFDDNFEWMPKGFENAEGKLIVTGWVPQMLILNHPAVGGFMTHCGWNSSLEGASAGVPMIAWPLFAEQSFNEKLLVSVLRIGVSVGAKVCSYDETKRTVVRAEVVEKAVRDVMGSGEEAEERRKRAKEMAEMAKKAVELGGSSYNEMSRLIQELTDLKAGN